MQEETNWLIETQTVTSLGNPARHDQEGDRVKETLGCAVLLFVGFCVAACAGVLITEPVPHTGGLAPADGNSACSNSPMDSAPNLQTHGRWRQLDPTGLR